MEVFPVKFAHAAAVCLPPRSEGESDTANRKDEYRESIQQIAGLELVVCHRPWQLTYRGRPVKSETVWCVSVRLLSVKHARVFVETAGTSVLLALAPSSSIDRVCDPASETPDKRARPGERSPRAME